MLVGNIAGVKSLLDIVYLVQLLGSVVALDTIIVVGNRQGLESLRTWTLQLQVLLTLGAIWKFLRNYAIVLVYHVLYILGLPWKPFTFGLSG